MTWDGGLESSTWSVINSIVNQAGQVQLKKKAAYAMAKKKEEKPSGQGMVDDPIVQ